MIPAQNPRSAPLRFRYRAPVKSPAAVTFGPWQPLAAAAQGALPTPGVLQARGDALFDLPRGKSAMVLYAASALAEPLSGFVMGSGAALLERAAGLGAHLIRFAPAADPAAALDRLLGNFAERFGDLPPANRAPQPRTQTPVPSEST